MPANYAHSLGCNPLGIVLRRSLVLKITWMWLRENAWDIVSPLRGLMPPQIGIHSFAVGYGVPPLRGYVRSFTGNGLETSRWTRRIS